MKYGFVMPGGEARVVADFAAEAETAGWDALFVDHDRYWQGFDRYLPLFERGDPEPVDFEVQRGGHPAHQFRVYRYFNFKGSRQGG